MISAQLVATERECLYALSITENGDTDRFEIDTSTAPYTLNIFDADPAFKQMQSVILMIVTEQLSSLSAGGSIMSPSLTWTQFKKHFPQGKLLGSRPSYLPAMQ